MISYLVSVYNKEKYVVETLQSVINSLSEGDEIIIVNDGSTDKSAEIIEKYLNNKDLNVNFINRKINKGVVYTKMEALKNAMNKYVVFVDGDDILNYSFFLQLDKTKLKKDTLFLSNIQEFCDRFPDNIEMKYNYFQYDINKYIEELMKDDFQNSLCNKIYFKEYLFKCFESLNNNINFAEDLYINLEYVKFINKIYKFDAISIFYRKGISSLTTKFSKNQFNRIALIPFKFREKFIEDSKLSNRYFYYSLNKFTEMSYSAIKSYKTFGIKNVKINLQEYILVIKKYNYSKYFIYLNFKNKYRCIYLLYQYFKF